ncbi:C-type lectin domain family 10 member A-like isoform X1 [Ruditapes philippinarum]|uniref:C-type lectin domain family 10 member A-like isoform X1 n=1 Tax=Ruditapes philippinarum TaxID=129788 RepID=UPI00295BA6DF|nr:C-type lectin domain family 10 member A-like isoform X1 [Ruditapes philippinarum]
MYDNLNVDMELKNRTEQDNIYETLQHGTRELADKTTPSAKKCTPLLLWCTLVNSILIGLLIIAVSVSLYMCINDSKASNSKENMKSIAELVENITKDVVVENMKSMAELVQNITKDLKKSTSGLDDLKSVTDRINSKCEDGLSDMSEKIAGLEKNIGELKPITINKPLSNKFERQTSTGCPIDFIKHDNSCYHIFATPTLKWWEAMAYCQIYGGGSGTLATVESESEQLFLENKLKEAFRKFLHRFFT